MINNDVGQRDVHVVDTVDAQQAADRALHRDGGVLVNEALGVCLLYTSGPYLDYYNNRRIKAKLKGLPPAIHRQQALSAA